MQVVDKILAGNARLIVVAEVTVSPLLPSRGTT